MPRNRRRFFSLVLIAVLNLGLSACGFHLRGTTSAALPEGLDRLRLTMADSRLAYPPVLVEVRNALQGVEGVSVANQQERAPLLTLFGEYFDTQVVAVDRGGRATAYLLNYKVSFKLADAQGRELLPAQSVKLQREYTFDRLNVLAKEREEEYLKLEMQRDAAQQILRRLAAAKPPASAADAAPIPTPALER